MRPRFPDRLRTAVVLTAVVLLAGVALAAAHRAAPRGTSPVASRGTGTAVVADPGAPAGGVSWGWIPYLAVLLVLVAAILFFALRDGLILSPVEAAPERDAIEPERRAGSEAAAVRTRDDALADAAAALADGGEAREVVIACWRRLEQAAEASGRGRRPAETATDVARRWLGPAGDPGDAAVRDAVGTLAGLFHEARYSTHPMTDRHRAVAIDALHRLVPGRVRR